MKLASRWSPLVLAGAALTRRAAPPADESVPPPGLRDAGIGLRALAVALFGLLALAGYFLLTDSARKWDANSIRLQRSFVLVAGESIYPDPDSGPILLSLYPPLSAVAYLPAAVMRGPAAAGLAGQVLSVLYFFLPVLWLHLKARRRPGAHDVFGFLSFAALATAIRPLEYVAYSVHVDAPTLCLGALACGALGRGKDADGLWRQAIAATCSVLAVWSKQTIVALPVVLLLYVFLVRGRRSGLRFFLCLAISSLLVLILMVLLFGPVEEMFFHIWTLPSLHPVEGSVVKALVRLGVETSGAWLLFLAALGWRLRRRPGGWIDDPAVLYGLVGVAMVPFAILSYLKVGGDVNTMSYVAYFLLAGATLSLAEQARHEPRVRLAIRVVPAAVLVVVLLRVPLTLASWDQPLRLSELSCQIAFAYAKEHPGRVYFPDLTLSSLLAEGEVYHDGTGLWDRELADRWPDDEHLRSHVPADLEGVAYNVARLSDEEKGFFQKPKSYLPELSRLTFDPELPGFVVFRREEEAEARSGPNG